MTMDESLARFGVVPKEGDLSVIRDILRDATAQERTRQGTGDTELMKLSCVQLFCAGHVEDAMLIWGAKTSSMDADGSIDIQLLCSAGLGPTRAYLANLQTKEAEAVLDRLAKTEAAGDFEGFNTADYCRFWQQYYLESFQDDLGSQA
jgi:hypothetical protein